jgi:hypothetical protein
MGENKNLNLKDKTSLKRFAKHPNQVLCWKQLERNYMISNRKWYGKIPHFQQKSTEICVLM